ncbi:MAG: hypothetical protein KY468_16510, partial [Armatimonadetes bacterium]|nr:hypothetical protein [Armatimonadota bacterium]
MILQTRLTMAVSAAMLLFPLAAMQAQEVPLNPYPHRESKLITSFETSVEDWTSTPLGSEVNLATQNTDPKFASHGTKSLKVDLTGKGDWWVDPWFSATLTEPVDITGYQYFSMDVYVPQGSLMQSVPAENKWRWYQYNLVMNGSDWYGNRDIKEGWNRLVWALKPEQDGQERLLNTIKFPGAMNKDLPYQGPVYIDNLRVWKGQLPGLKQDEVLLTGFEDPALADNIQSGAASTTLIVNKTDHPEHVKDGNNALEVDMTGQQGWGEYAITTLPQPVDASKATAFLVDVFIPAGHQPTDWNQNGLRIDYLDPNDETRSLNLSTFTLGLQNGQWETLELAVTPEQAAQMKKVTGFRFTRNSDGGAEKGQWRGPIYFDNVRFVVPPVTGCKGDANTDKAINVGDAVVILKHSVAAPGSADILTGNALAAADVDASGT